VTEDDVASTDVRGGCQCGAVRYRLGAVPSGTHVCHRRMCQKAGGAPFMASVPASSFVITRGALWIFKSSDIAERGFCAACGTPLTYHFLPGNLTTVTLGSLDDPNAFVPHSQYGTEARVTWLTEVLAAPETSVSDWFKRKGIVSVGSHQHPDHER
jgi:hypothetical protein